MSKHLYFPLLVLLMMLTGISNTFSQEAVKQEAIKNKKERQELLSKELGLNQEQSAKLLEQQEKYREQVARVLQDTSLRAPQRSVQLKALSQQYRASLSMLLSPQQREKMSASIRGRSQEKAQQHRQQLESRLPKGRNKALTADSTKVKPRN
ncbi:glucose-6-phosphate-specific signal transduction histidine kinase [Pedobacter sp. W3I1]|uniref:hypothetical protein n=1 Tax=Pedobacter sp. W3I1 TaxID=3042291 RepID=UPI00277F311A|nr:hypothetical protein [Pedobacter sp. W3I1]MDQ0640982.1 glucose-6-phosphate-specific signal transduction histidine kinase [Pedobacter sp. W3I1]